ncbi:acetyltransferase [Halomonas mongoliensis]|uniref:acetyltransferase n=1 Tax=Halomonas mongoliensis TaxID=321265 RepID=UPI00403B2319
MSKLAILGASGHGKVVADIALSTGWGGVAFYDDAWPEKNRLEHWEIFGSRDELLNRLQLYDGIAVAIGNNEIRKNALQHLETAGAKLPTLIHPSAIVSQFARVESGCVLVAGAIVNAFARLGKGCIVNTGATIGHDCWLDACVHVAPGANVAGGVVVGSGSWVGIGSSIKQLTRIGSEVTIGAGAAVVQNVPDGITVAGVPARPIF